MLKLTSSAHILNISSTYTKIGMLQRLACPVHKDNMQIHKVFHIFEKIKSCKLIVITNKSQGYNVQHREYSQ